MRAASRIGEARDMPSPILVGYDAKTSERGPVNLAAAISRATGARLVIASVYSGGVIWIASPQASTRRS